MKGHAFLIVVLIGLLKASLFQIWAKTKKFALRLSITPTNLGPVIVSLCAFIVLPGNVKAGTWVLTGASAKFITATAISASYATDQTLFLGTSAHGVFKSTNGGATWTEINTGLADLSVSSLAISPDFYTDRTVFVGTFAGIFKTTDGGSTWFPVNNGLTYFYFSSLAISPNYSTDHTIFAGFTQSGIYKSTDGGASWTLVFSISDVTALAVSPEYAVDQTVFAGTRLSGILKSTDAGTTWITANPASGTPSVRAIAISPHFTIDQTVITINHFPDRILKSTDGGLTWAATNSGLGSAFPSSLGLSPNYATDKTIFVGTGDQIFKSTDGGLAWTAVLSALGSGMSFSVDTHPFAISPNYAADQTVFVGFSGGAFKSTNAGVTWVAANSGLSNPFVHSLAVSPDYTADQTVFAVNRYAGLLMKSTDGASSWITLSTGINNLYMSSFAISPTFSLDQTQFAGTIGGGVFKSTDGGTAWTAVNSGLTDWRILSLEISPNFPADKTLFSGTMFSGTIGNLFKSTDAGASWNVANLGLPSAQLSFIAISPNYAADQTVFVAFSSTTLTGAGGVFKSTNAGESWSSANNGLSNLFIRSLAISPAFSVDRTIFASTAAAAGIYRTTDGGASWILINNGLYVSSLAISPNYESDHTLFASDGNAVFKSTDRGITWANLDAPGGLINSLAISPGYPCDGILYAGTEFLFVLKYIDAEAMASCGVTSAPIISSVSPSSTVAGTFDLTINGSNFDVGAVDQIYTPTGAFMGQGTIKSRTSTQIVVTEFMTGAGTGNYTVKVKNSDGQLSNGVTLTIIPPPPSSYSISGRVTFNGTGLPGVTMTLSEAASPTRITDSAGTYSFTSLADGTYTVTPSLSGYTFTPTSRSVTLAGADVSGQDFSATVSSSTLNVQVLADNSGSPLSGALVTLSDNPATYTTDATGQVPIPTIAGSKTVFAFKDGYKPVSQAVTVVSGSNTVTLRLPVGDVLSVGQVTTTPLTLQEIEERGVNLSDPENFSVYDLSVNLTLGGTQTTLNQNSVILPLNPTPGTTTTLQPTTVQFGGIEAAIQTTVIALPNGRSAYAFLVLPAKLLLLKEFFDVKAVIKNDASPDFIITALSATLTVPTGLTLVPLSGLPQLATKALGDLAGGSQIEATWVVRGDTEGTYTLGVSATGTLQPFGIPLTAGNSGTVQVLGAPTLPPVHSISGRITSNGTGVPSVTLTLVGGLGGTASTASDGTYAFPNLIDGTYTITTSRSGYTFSPASLTVNVAGLDVPNQNFSATLVVPPATHSISGRVTFNGSGLPNVTMTLSGTGVSSIATTQDDGSYLFLGLEDGTYTIMPSLSPCTFTPVNRSVTLSGQNVSVPDFVASFQPVQTPNITLIDPVYGAFSTKLLDIFSPSVAYDDLATKGRIVEGIAADGVAHLLIRIPATSVNQPFSLTLVNDHGDVGSPINDDGVLGALGEDLFAVAIPRTVNVTAVNTSAGPTAFAIYRAPVDFVREAFFLSDARAVQRTVTIQIESGGQILARVPVSIVRPPVVLVHGLWEGTDDWKDFYTALINDEYNRFAPFRAIESCINNGKLYSL